VSEENVDAVRRMTASAVAGDWDAAVALMAPEVEWVIAREHPEARTLVGRRALVDYQRAWQETLPDMEVEVDRLLDGGRDKVIGMGAVRGTGAGSGAGVRVSLAVVYTVRDGLIVRAQEFLNPHDALKAVGLKE
jgi:ketosteroid isomerase-like protein